MLADAAQLELLMIVDDGDIARFVAANGVDRLFVDLEIMGKEARQGHLDTVRSVQSSETVSRIRAAAPDAHLLVRINPLHDGSAQEIDDAIARGADSVMLPMFRDAQTLFAFLDLLGGRAQAIPLFETQGALDAVEEILAAKAPLKRAHIGLNDLHLDRGDAFLLQPLAGRVLDAPAERLSSVGVPFGIGGLARVGEGEVPPEMLLAEHVRLGSTGAILSRTFHRNARSVAEIEDRMDFAAEVGKLRAAFQALRALPALDLVERSRAARSAIKAAVDRRVRVGS